MLDRWMDRVDLDFFLVALPYTLLDQDVLDTEFPRLAELGMGVVIGAVFASGILATGPIDDARYAYAPASEAVKEKTRRLAEVCGRHGVPLAAAALQFPLGHPSVAAVIPGAFTADQVSRNVATFRPGDPGRPVGRAQARRLDPCRGARPWLIARDRYVVDDGRRPAGVRSAFGTAGLAAPRSAATDRADRVSTRAIRSSRSGSLTPTGSSAPWTTGRRRASTSRWTATAMAGG